LPHRRFSRIRQMAPMCTLSNTCFLGPTRVHNPNGMSIASAVFARPFVKRFALCYHTVVLSVCPVCDVGVLWPNGWMDQDTSWHGGRHRLRPHCVRWGPIERGTAAPHFCNLRTEALTASYIKRPMSIVNRSTCHLVQR